jgi:hypothetical protein
MSRYELPQGVVGYWLAAVERYANTSSDTVQEQVEHATCALFACHEKAEDDRRARFIEAAEQYHERKGNA